MKFEVGEFAIIANAVAYPHLVGKVTCIMEIDARFRSPYRTDARDDNTLSRLWAADHNLRKLPPREEPESLVRKLECEA